MSKMKEVYQEQIDNDDYYFPPDVEYTMTYQGRYGKFIPSLINWFNKKYCDPRRFRTKYFQHVKADDVECPF